MAITGRNPRQVVVIDDDEQVPAHPTGGRTGSHLNHPLPETSKRGNSSTRAYQSQSSLTNSIISPFQPKSLVQTNSAQQLKRSVLDCFSAFKMPAKPSLAPKTPSSAASTFRSSENHVEQSSNPALGLQSNNLPPASAVRNRHRGPVSARPWLCDQRDEVIDLDDDDFPDRSDLNFMSDSMTRSATAQVQSCITSDLRNSMSDDKFRRWIAQQAIAERSRPVIRSLTPPSPPKVPLQNCTHNGIQLRSNIAVELTDGDFMRIVQVLEDHVTKQVYLSGYIFRRTRYMNGTIPKKSNEVCEIIQLNESDSRSAKEQALQEVPVTQAKRRRGLRLTNQEYPALSWRTDPPIDQKKVEDLCILVCRWKYVSVYRDAAAQKKNVWKGKALIRLRKEECDGSLACSEKTLREHWRGETLAGGSAFGMSSTETEQVDRERKLVQDAVEKLHRQVRISGTSRSSVARPASPGFSASTPVLIDTLSCSGVPVCLDSPSSNTIAGSTSVRRTSAKGASQLIQDMATPKAAEHLPCNPPVDLTIDDDLITGLEFCSFTQRKRDNDRLLRPTGETLPGKSRSDSLEVLDVDAFIKTTSNRGVAARRVEARITTDYSRMPTQKRDHNAAFPTFPSRRPALTGHNLRNMSQIARPMSSNLSCHQRPSSPTDSDSTVGKERSPSLLIGEERKPRLQSMGQRRNIRPLGRSRSPRTSAAARPPTVAESTHKCLQRYTFGDGFCGCGGVSRGARMAGLSLTWAFDYENAMCASYLTSFPDSSIYCCSAYDFATSNKSGLKVDVLHLSPPCQFFSPAHTIEGQNDENNTASSFAVTDLLERAKPRIVTLENTMGLEQRHPLYLNAVVQQFTALGFSIRWKVIDLRNFGVPQSRRRLIFIAACPGEVLPEFPKPTHSNDPQKTGLKPWSTIDQSISGIPAGWPNHDMALAQPTNHPPFDGNTFAKTMTCSGGVNNYHPSGKRGYTVREYACLQTFPLEHGFANCTKTLLKKQIGNAVPPVFYKCLAETIVQSLKKTDGI